ncbi:MAG: glycosyltransferase [Saprospiraceae bacterium]|nr:glycosyltransferase [Saprospiraceae bacterium]
MGKSIAIVSDAFYPENRPRSFRTTALAEEFNRIGYSVTVFTSTKDISHSDFTNAGIKIVYLPKAIFQPIEIKCSGVELFARRVARRLLLVLFGYPKSDLIFRVNQVLKKAPFFNILISVAAPHAIHWGVARCRRKKRRIAQTWIADCGDPFMGQENDTFRPAFYFKWIEKWFCRKADFITVPSSDAIAGYYPEFHQKIRVIPQGFDFTTTPVWKGHLENEVPNFAYAGGFIPKKRDPRPILEFLLACDLDFRFHIYTKQDDFLTQYAESSKGKVVLHRVIPREQLIFELSRMDFLLNIENVGSIQSPSKLIDYAIAGRPVLSVNSNSLDQTKFRNFLNRDYTGRLILSEVDNYRIEKVVAQFIKCHDEHQS